MCFSSVFYLENAIKKVLYLEPVLLYINSINWLNIEADMIGKSSARCIFVPIDVILLHIISSF